MTEGEIATSKRMRDDGATWNQIARETGYDPQTVKYALDPDYANRRREQINANRRRARGEEQKVQPDTQRRPEVRVSDEDWNQRISEIPDDRRDLTGKMLGDPLFERSALGVMKNGDQR